jgi:signal transduction histidine kinase
VDSLLGPAGVTTTEFYAAMYATAVRERGGHTRRAGGSALRGAVPPADRLSAALDDEVAQRVGVPSFELHLAPGPAVGRAFAIGGDTLRFRVDSLLSGTAALGIAERSRVPGALLLAAALVALLVGGWQRPASLAWRVVPAATALLALAIIPLNQSFSNVTSVFDATYYFVPFGGAYTASVGALALTASLALLVTLAALRSRVRVRSRIPAMVIVATLAALGPFVLRNLAKGITPPTRGVPVRLWIAWEIALFLAATAIMLAGISAGRSALGARRGVSPALAPVLAGIAAVAGPMLWEAPGRWPEWYPLVWVGAIALLALARRTRWFVINAALVAGFGAVILVWGATARKRVELAEQDVRGLDRPSVDVEALVVRFSRQLESAPPPRDRGELLQRYVASDLVPAGYPVDLAIWDAPAAAFPAAERLRSELVLSEFQARTDAVAEVVGEARRVGSPVARWSMGERGIALLLAIPYPDGTVMSAAVAPRTRLYADDPFIALLGLAPTASGDPPYQLTTTPVSEAPQVGSDSGRWQRRGDELHGDWIVRSASGPLRAHAEVELRSLLALVQRGALVVLLDLTLVAALWTMTAAAGGGVPRWARTRVRRWTHSYRSRLTLALFGFFVIPAITFAVWTYRQLQKEDQQSRELLVGETLRSIADAGGGRVPVGESGDARLDVGVPLFVYRAGVLASTSDSLYDVLAPVGRFLHPSIALTVARGDEVTASRHESVGGLPTLFGYRQTVDEADRRTVLAAPARSGELVLDLQRRDLGILVLFATAVGGLAALTLSGLAARELSRPIGSLRRGAIAIARGEREPELAERPPSEFAPVFSAVRSMAADLSASRSALEDAQRRTERVLRNVASGVVGLDSDGRVTLANPRAESLLERALAPGAEIEAAGNGIAPRVRDFLAEEGDEEVEFDLELRGRQIRGRLTRLTRATPEGRRPAGAVLTLDDLTELARAQRVLAWGEMARQVAHEIKNPLTPIRLGVQHLRRARKDARVDFDRVLDANVERILGEIDRLDEIARPFSQYGTVPGERAPGEPVDAAAVVRDVVELERMGAGGVEWCATGVDEPAWAVARADELREVLLNVLENARLAGARTVTVAVRREMTDAAPRASVAPGPRVSIEVADDGHGIPADVMPRIFEPHFSTRTSGSGLGLAISRRLVDAWGGEISVASETGRGTTVRIALATASAA